MTTGFTRLFEKAVTWTGVPTVLALAALLISVNQFRFAEALLVVAGSWVIGWIISLRYFKTPFHPNRDILLWMLVLGGVFIVIIFWQKIEECRVAEILKGNEGLLLDADDIAPVRCNIGNISERRSGRRVLMLGSVPFVTNFFPHNVIHVFDPLRGNDTNLLSINVVNDHLAL